MKSWLMRLGVLLCFGLCLHTTTPICEGAAFSGQNILVVRVGNGTTLLGPNAAAVDILEISAVNGSIVQTISMPSTGTSALTLSGNSTSEGILSSFGPAGANNFTLAGYRADALSTNVSTSTVARVVGHIDAGGNANTGTTLGTAFSGLSIKSAVSIGGNTPGVSASQIYVTGQAGVNGGLAYATGTLGGAQTVTNLGAGGGGNNPNELRQVQVHGTNLLVAGAGNPPGRAIFDVGGGLPTSGSPTYNNANSNQPGKEYNSFYFTRLSTDPLTPTWTPAGSADTGYDTFYGVDSANGTLEKWSFTGGAWVARASIVNGDGLLNVAGITYGKNTLLYVTSPTNLLVLNDTSGFNVNLNGSFSNIAAAGTNFEFRGVAIVPEPGSLALCGMAGAGFVGFVLRRRKKAKPAAE